MLNNVDFYKDLARIQEEHLEPLRAEIYFWRSLAKTIPQRAIFRVWGDRFVIADYKNEIGDRPIGSLLKNRGIEYKIITLEGEISSTKEIMAAI